MSAINYCAYNFIILCEWLLVCLVRFHDDINYGFNLQIEHKPLTLGEVLDGDRMAKSLYNIQFKSKLMRSIQHFSLPQHTLIAASPAIVELFCNGSQFQLQKLSAKNNNFSRGGNFHGYLQLFLYLAGLFTEDVSDQKLCDKKYGAEDLEEIKEAIEDLYYFEFVIGKITDRICHHRG